jgi:hypothetical protein
MRAARRPRISQAPIEAALTPASPAAGERCGDHLVAAYLAKVNAMKRQFLRLAANGRK